jgi:dihydroxyacetone kinase
MAVLANASGDTTSLITSISAAVESSMDGTSGALYSIYLNALVQHFSQHENRTLSAMTPSDWAIAMRFAMDALSKYTPARVGDRTVIDALVPFINALEAGQNWGQAARAAMDGAEATKTMTASLGRAVYVGMENEWKGKIPDPGAWGLAKFFEGLCQHTTSFK